MSYGLYLGTVVGSNEVAKSGELDGRLKVRILPQLKDIKDSSMLPSFPYFFKDKMLVGKVNDLVWLICNDDFSSGYVLGLANYNCYTDEVGTFTASDKDSGTKIKLAIPNDLKEAISNTSVDLGGQVIGFQDIEVTYWNNNCIHFVERSTGGVIYAFRSKTLYIFRPEGLTIYINGSTKFTLTNTSISMNAESINLDSKNVGLGHEPSGNVMVNNGDRAEVSFPSTCVKA